MNLKKGICFSWGNSRPCVTTTEGECARDVLSFSRPSLRPKISSKKANEDNGARPVKIQNSPDIENLKSKWCNHDNFILKISSISSFFNLLCDKLTYFDESAFVVQFAVF